MKKGIIALICMIVTLVFIIVALVTPWYGGSGDVEMMGQKAEVSYSLSLTEGEAKSEGLGTKSTEKIDYDDETTGFKSVFDNTMYITIIALITAIIALVCILLMTFSSGNMKMFKMLGGIFGILTVIFALLAPIYFMTALPPELSDDSSQWGGEDIGFWDEVNIAGMKISFGPSIAWYLMIVSFVTALIASIIVFMEKPGTPMPSTPMQQQPRPPQ